MVAAEAGCSDEEVEAVRTGGRLHDIGKIGIREEILNKQGPLTEEEYEHVKQHVTVGSQILSPLVHLRDVIGFVRSHHERWDGTGYPDHSERESSARWKSMTHSPRPAPTRREYHPRRPWNECAI
jgi:putative nucleotidyltransferase with HDIG domain